MIQSTQFGTEKLKKGIILGLLLALFAMLAYYSHSKNLYCGRMDQPSYLSTAIWLGEHGGPTNFMSLCLSGEYKEANRQPLYILLSSAFASRDIQFFIKSKILSTLIAFIFFTVLFVVVKKEFGFPASVVSIGLLITSNIFVQYLSWVACEYLLITFTLLTWYFTIKGFDNNRLWIWAGFFNGLAYVSKASGLVLLPVFFLTYLIIGLKSKTPKMILKNNYFYLYFLAFILASSPLLIRNIVVYNNPLYNLNQKYMWLDWGESVGKMTPEQINKLSMTTYLKTHSIKEIVQKFVFGFRAHSRPFLHSFRNVFYIGVYYWELIIFILAIVFIIKDNHPTRKIYNIVLFCVFYLIITLYPWSEPRFFMPVTSIFMIYSGLGASNLLERFAGKIKLGRYCPNHLVLILIAIFLSLVSFMSFTKIDFNKNPLKMYAYHDGEEELASWMRESLKDSDVILQTSVNTHVQYVLTSGLFFPIKGRRSGIPLKGDFAELSELIKANQITHIIIYKNSFYFNTSFSYTHKFKDYFKVTPEEGLQIRIIPPEWELIYADPEPPVDFLVFKIENKPLSE